MDKINAVESNMEKTRASAADDMAELEAESKALKEKLEKLDFELEI